jgi:ADP-ribose pyrophosphatase YjhB (NUDIX family)
MQNNPNTIHYPWLDIAKRLQALAQAGLEYSENKYDQDRYQQIRDISLDILHSYTNIPMSKLTETFASERGYQTPKVDIRGVVFRADKILMVRETIDGRWSIPGGWADVGLTPYENVCKEVFEESGLIVKPVRLLAVLDKKCHNHPPDLFHIYKLFILCEEMGGKLKGGMETDDTGFFGLEELPVLSEPRITKEQIALMFDYKIHKKKPSQCD